MAENYYAERPSKKESGNKYAERPKAEDNLSYEDNKRISTEIFTRLTKAVGFKKYPESHSDFVGKKLILKTEQIEDQFEGDNGVVNTKKTKIRLYLPEADADMSPPREAVPPF